MDTAERLWAVAEQGMTGPVCDRAGRCGRPGRGGAAPRTDRQHEPGGAKSPEKRVLQGMKTTYQSDHMD